MAQSEAMDPSPLRLSSSSSPASVDPQSVSSRAEKDTKKSSENSEDSKIPKFYAQFGKFFFMCCVLVLAYYFQVTGEAPLKVDHHETNDPHNFESQGYTCGCDLPIDEQEFLYKREADTSFNLNACYYPSALKDLNILMFSNSSAEQVESTLGRPVNVTNMASGLMIEMQAHAITGPLNSPSVNYSSNVQGLANNLTSLYPGGQREFDVGGLFSYFLGTEFLGFPKDYLRLAFTYCNMRNCTTDCGIEHVNQTFDKILSSERWGGCFPVDKDANACDPTIYDYQAKCTIYPTKTVPAVQIARRFFRELRQKHTNVQNITAPLAWGEFWEHTAVSLNSYNIAIEPSTVYMNHSKVTPSQVLLRYKHVDPQSASWLDLFRLFPSLDSSCSSLNITVCTGASLCNLFSNNGSPDIRCLDQSVLKNASFCKEVFENSALDNADQLCKDLGVTSEDSQTECACREQICNTIAPYLTTWNTSKYLAGDPMNAFLNSHILKDDWAKRTGLCTNQHSQVIPYNPGANETADEAEYTKTTIFLQGNCSEKRTGSGEYCWLTGKYRNFTDLNDTEWKDFNNTTVFYSNPNLGGLFVCYKINRQRTYVWILVTFGAAFGWAGSVDLLFKFLKWFWHERKEYMESSKSLKKEEKEKTEARGKLSRCSSKYVALERQE